MGIEIDLTKKLMFIFVFYEFIMLLASGFLGSLPIQNTSNLNTLKGYSNSIYNISSSLSNSFPSKSNPYPYINFGGVFGFLVSPINWIIGFFVFLYNLILLIVIGLGVIINLSVFFIPSVLNAYQLGALANIFTIINVAVMIIIVAFLIYYVRKWIGNIHI